MLFYHRGSQGDIIYSIPSIIALGGGDLCLGKRDQFENLHSLLRRQSCIGRVFHLDDLSDWSDIDINLDAYRPITRRNPNLHLALCHLVPWNLTFDLSDPWLDNIEENHVANIVVNRTSRYHDREEIDWSLLGNHADQCVFIGSDSDFASFSDVSGISIRRHRCEDALEFACVIRGSRLYIGNQSMGFALAEGMKHPRVLEVCHAKNNCHPQSDNGKTQLTEELIVACLAQAGVKTVSEVGEPITQNGSPRPMSDVVHAGENRMSAFKARDGQDRWVLDRLDGKHGGYFVDVGAHDGVCHSNTYVLEKEFEWKGICIEPNPLHRSFQKLIKNRTCICENVCVSSSVGIVQFVARGRHPEQSGIYAPFSGALVRDAVEKGNHETIAVLSLTLEMILDRHYAPKTIDYLSIDAEGAEWEILRNFDFNKYRFLTATVEHNYFGGTGFSEACKAKRCNIRRLLLKNGYVLDRAVGCEDWFVHNDCGR